MSTEAIAAQTAATTEAKSPLTAGVDQTGAAAPGSAAEQTTPAAAEVVEGAKPAEAAKPEGEKKTDEKPAGAPETYADFTLPEGYAVDKDLMGDFQSWAKESGLSQEAAQKAIDIYTKAGGKMAENQQKGWEAMKDGWAKETTEDKEVGGVNWDKTKASALLAIEKVGSPKLLEVLEMSGAANHVEVVKFLNKVGKFVADDKVMIGGVQSDTLTPEQRAYPSMFKSE